MASHFKAQVDVCVEKVLEARRAKSILAGNESSESD
jgi:hypothetical protein